MPVPVSTNPFGEVASALKEFFSWLKFFQGGAEVRKLKRAAKFAKLFIEKAEKSFPGILDDKTLQKYKQIFEESVI